MNRRTSALKPLWSESGQALIELAFSLPVLFLMLFGFINFALMMFSLSNVTFAAHAAARYAGAHSAQSVAPATNAVITAYLKPFLPTYPANTATVAITYPATGTNTVGGTVQVAVTVTYSISLPFFTLQTLKMTSKALAAITV